MIAAFTFKSLMHTVSVIRQKKHQRKLLIMENYNFESEIEETSKLMRE